MKSSILLALLAGSIAIACPAPKVRPADGHYKVPSSQYKDTPKVDDKAGLEGHPIPTTSRISSQTVETPPVRPIETLAPKPGTDSPVVVDNDKVVNTYGTTVSGKATFYEGGVANGNCALDGYQLPQGITGLALFYQSWDQAAHCGSCILVTGPRGNTIKAMVVDKCPTCDVNQLDLFPEAFSALADPVDGIIQTKFQYADCGITSPIVLRNKKDASKFWFSIQVRNSNQPIASLEVSLDNGSSWLPTTRSDYNFFENNTGYGTSSVDVRIKSVNGNHIIVKNVPVSSNAEKAAETNF